MTDQERNPEPRIDSDPVRRGEAAGGAMTGATGSLTPPESDEPFVPAEQRDIADPAHVGDLTGALGDPDAELETSEREERDIPATERAAPPATDASVGGDERGEPERF